jgi:hypothetical protein
MAISFTKYVNITSGVGGAGAVRQRDLIGRIFTANVLLAVGTMAEFDTLADVSTLFGSTSDEYKRAAFYFGWVSKNTTQAKKISFARWDNTPVTGETVTAVLTASSEANNNFGSFAFIPVLTSAQIAEAALWNNTQNVMYQFCASVPAADVATVSAAIIGYAGVSITLKSLVATEFHELIPMTILAATNYAKRNSVQNFMFQQFALTPSVTTTTLSTTYDELRANYYGRTQTAGQNLDFYQRGALMGGNTAPTDMNTYANEQWLKDAAGAQIMSLLIAMPKVSANAGGRAQLVTVLQDVIDRALFNGTISVGKELNVTQKVYIASVTGDDLAFHQIQSIGYWVDCTLESYVTVDGRTEWRAVYTLLYSKDDVIRAVSGTHTLI